MISSPQKDSLNSSDENFLSLWLTVPENTVQSEGILEPKKDFKKIQTNDNQMFAIFDIVQRLKHNRDDDSVI